MPEWWIIGIVIWWVVAFTGRRGCGWRSTPRTAPDSRRVGGREARPVRPRPPETAEQRLQREFVEGRLTMDEYERELARVLLPGREVTARGPLEG